MFCCRAKLTRYLRLMRPSTTKVLSCKHQHIKVGVLVCTARLQVNKFTHQQVTECRTELQQIEKQLASMPPAIPDAEKSPEAKALEERVIAVGKQFLELEKFVNVNFTGFYKVRDESVLDIFGVRGAYA